ncbi:MAG: exonuclease SbcC [Thermoproteota archaeon]|nr:exonuclease SbcC [Thermoproteota archaeon]
MVFGWGKKKPEQSEVDVIPEEKQISLTEISDIIKDIRSIRTRTIIAEVKAFRNKINSDRKTILEIANQLERDTLNVDEMDIHLMRLVKRGKNEIISVIKRECKVVFPEVNSFENVQTFDRLASRMLKKIGDALGRHSQVIHIFAKKYAKKLKSDLKIMTDGNSHVIELIENYRELENKIKQLFENIDKHDQAQKSIVTLELHKDDVAKTLQDLNNAIEHDAQDIKNIKDSSEYVEFLKTKEKINSMDSESIQIKNEIDLQFTKISRPLNKYVYVSSLDKLQKKILEDLIENPYRVLSNTNKQDVIRILESVRKSVQSGSVSVKDINKSISQIDETFSKLDGFIKQIFMYNQKKNNVENELTVFNNKQLESKESDLAKRHNFKLDAESKIKSSDEEFKFTTELIPKLVNNIESILNKISAVQYRIKV